jgi:ribosome biogenesis GTPase A
MLIQWYPGHIAKAEKELEQQLRRVDVVLEVRDARIIATTAHPNVPKWVEGKQHLVICNRMDTIAPAEQRAWQDYLRGQQVSAFFTNARSGEGVRPIMALAQTGAEVVNQRRRQRGMLDRPARAVVVGFPNVGKSALINRLLNRRVAASANKAGVTRQLRWIRISPDLELLDVPGVIPPLLSDQDKALKLAICDDIGMGSYDAVTVAGLAITLWHDRGIDLSNRYGLNYENSGMEYLYQLSEKLDRGDYLRTAQRVLHDFRSGRLGAFALELPR